MERHFEKHLIVMKLPLTNLEYRTQGSGKKLELRLGLQTSSSQILLALHSYMLILADFLLFI